MFAFIRHCSTPLVVRRSAVLAGLLCSAQAHAVLTDSLTIGSAKALALGHAVTADPPGIDSIHFNPAGLAKLKGRQSQLKVVAADFSIQLKFGDYVPERKAWMDSVRAAGYVPESYFADEAHNTVSETEGAALVLPGLGMTDLPVLIGPMGGISYNPPGSDLTIGTSVYAPLAVGFYRADDDPGRFIGQRLSFTLLSYFTPTFAYEFNEEWSVGATMTFNYAGVGMDLPFRSGGHSIGFLADVQNQTCSAIDPNTPAENLPALCQGGRINLYDQLGTLRFTTETQLTFGFNVGVLWQPTGWATVGMVYQAPISMKMKGEFEWKNDDVWNLFLAPLKQTGTYDQIDRYFAVLGWELPKGQAKETGSAKLDMEMPEHYAIGTSLKLTPRIKWNIDYKHTAWSSWESIPVKFGTAIDFLRLAEIIQPDLSKRASLTFPLGLVDTWNWSTGIEYQYNDQLALRFGIEDRPSSIPREARSPLLPMGAGKLYSTGFGYKLENGGEVDFGLGYFTSKVDMPGGTSRLGNSLNPYLVIYNPFPGTDVTADLKVLLAEFSYRRAF